MKLHQCPLTAEEKNRMIAQAAYYRYQKRGGTGGNSVEDWLAAEAEVEEQLRDSCQPGPQARARVAYQKMRSGVQKIIATSREIINSERTGPPFDPITKRFRELGESVPGAFENVGKRTRRGIDATGAKLGHSLEEFRVRRARLLHDTSENLKSWMSRHRSKDK
jgi:hypothetical protein